MKRLNIFLASILSFWAFKFARNFLSKYEILVFDKEDLAEDEMSDSMDLRGTPTHECICGSNQFYVRVVFHNYEIAQYFLDMQCANCGSLATAPTLSDKETSE